MAPRWLESILAFQIASLFWLYSVDAAAGKTEGNVVEGNKDCCQIDAPHAIQIGSKRYSCGFPSSEMSYSFDQSKDAKSLFKCSCSLPQNCSQEASTEQKFGFTSQLSNKRLPLDRVNDQICDTGDDEPATSACAGKTPSAFFYCSAGIPKLLPASRVEDGVLDCCDCSDEPSKIATCDKRACAQEREMMEREERERADIVVGGITRLREISIASQDRLQALKSEYDSQKSILQSYADEIKSLESSLTQETEVESQEQTTRKTSILKSIEDILDRLVSSPSNLAKIIARVAVESGERSILKLKHSLVEHAEFSKTLSETCPDFEAKVTSIAQQTPSQEQQQQEDGALSTQATRVQELVDSLAMDKAPKSLLWDVALGKLDGQLRDVIQIAKEGASISAEDERKLNKLVDELDAPYSRPQASELRQKIADVRQKESDFNSKMSKLDKLMALDLGVNATFLHLYEKEFTLQSGEFLFKFRPLEKCEQGSTDLGKFTSWTALKDTDVIPQEIDQGKRVPRPSILMKFENGLRCYQGTIRSTTVYMRCGKDDALIKVFEPEVCRYVYLFTTPIACMEKDVLLSASDSSLFSGIWRKAKRLLSWF